MKLAKVMLQEPISDLGGSRVLTPGLLTLDYDAGLVTITRPAFPQEEPFLVPMSNVRYMRPERPEKAKPKT